MGKAPTRTPFAEVDRHDRQLHDTGRRGVSAPANLEARLVRLVEALEDGDSELAQGMASDLVDEALCPGRRLACGCGLSFEWPGEQDHHRRMSDHERAA